MKTIKKGKEIKRVKDKMAMALTKKGWKYCPKSEYKSFLDNDFAPVMNAVVDMAKEK